MNKILLYVATAVVLGLFLTLIPLMVFAKIGAENHYALRESLSKGFERIENVFGTKAREYLAFDLEVLAFSFVIALVAYVLFKFRLL